MSYDPLLAVLGLSQTNPTTFAPTATQVGVAILPAALPSSPATGGLAIDSGDGNKLKWWNGSAWQSAGSSVTIGGSIAATQVAYGSGPNTIAGANGFVFDAVNVRLGLSDSASLFAPSTTVHLSKNSNTGFRADTYSNTPAAVAGIQLYKARGTAAVPLAVQTGDSLGFIGVYGYGATVFSNTSRAKMEMLAAENWTDAAQGTYVTIGTTSTGSVTLTERIRFYADGGVKISGTSGSFTTSPGNGVLSITQNQELTPLTGTVLQVVGTNNVKSRIEVAAFGPGAYASFTGRSARGNPNTPSNSHKDDIIAAFTGCGYGATGWPSTNRMSVYMSAAEAWTDAAQGSYISLNTTLNGTIILLERVRVWDDGSVQIGGTYTAGIGANALQVAGVGAINTTVSATAALNLPASTTGVSSLRIAHGTAPTVPVNGDIWTTTSGMYVQINGVTQLLGTGTIGGSIAATQVAYGSGSNAITGSAAFTYTTAAKLLQNICTATSGGSAWESAFFRANWASSGTTNTSLTGIESQADTTGTGTNTGSVVGGSFRAQNANTSGTLTQMLGADVSFNATGNGSATTTAYGLRISVQVGAGHTVTTLYGLYLGYTNNGAVTNPYGIYQADTGVTNYFAGTVSVVNTTASTSTITGAVTVGGDIGVAGQTTTKTFAVAVASDNSTGVINSLTNADGFIRLTGAAPDLRGIANPGANAGRRLVLYCTNATTIRNLAGTAAVGDKISIEGNADVVVPASRNVEFIYDTVTGVWRMLFGTGVFTGSFAAGTTQSTTTALNLPASTTTVSSLRMAHGVAPTVPVNGDFWTTTSGVFAQVNGVTAQLNNVFSGSLATNQIAFGSGTNAITSEASLYWDPVNKVLDLGNGSGGAAYGNIRTAKTFSGLTSFNGNYFLVAFAPSSAITSATQYGARWYCATSSVAGSNYDATSAICGQEYQAIFQASSDAALSGLYGHISTIYAAHQGATGTVTVNTVYGHYCSTEAYAQVSGGTTIVPTMFGIYLRPYISAVAGGTVTVQNYFGLYIADYLLTGSGTTSFTTKYSIYQVATTGSNYFGANSQFAGVVAVGGAAISTTTALNTPAGTTGVSSLRVPHGVAPTVPVDGDMWSTTSGAFMRINGVTSQITNVFSGSVTNADRIVYSSAPNTFTSDAAFTIRIGASSPSWTTTGIGFVVGSSTYTDTTSSGSVPNMGIHLMDSPTVAASVATTFTQAATLLVNRPLAGTNATITNAWGIIAYGGGSGTAVGGGIRCQTVPGITDSIALSGNGGGTNNNTLILKPAALANTTITLVSAVSQLMGWSVTSSGNLISVPSSTSTATASTTGFSYPITFSGIGSGITHTGSALTTTFTGANSNTMTVRGTAIGLTYTPANNATGGLTLDGLVTTSTLNLSTFTTNTTQTSGIRSSLTINTSATAGTILPNTTAAIRADLSVLAQNASGSNTITRLVGVYIRPGVFDNGFGGTQVTTTLAGLYLDNFSATGLYNITNFYQIYLGTVTSAGTITNKWGVYQADTTATNYFAGGVNLQNQVTLGVTSIVSAGGTTVLTTTALFVVITGTLNEILTLPAATAGRYLMIKSRTSGLVTINRAGADTIDGATSYSLPAGSAIALVANGTDWTVN